MNHDDDDETLATLQNTATRYGIQGTVSVCGRLPISNGHVTGGQPGSCMWVIGEREIGNQVRVSLCVWSDLGFRFRGSFVRGGGCWCGCVGLVGSELGPGRYHGVGLVLGQTGGRFVFFARGMSFSDSPLGRSDGV